MALSKTEFSVLKLILFDIDGTLLTSIGTGRRALMEAIQSVCGRSIAVDGVQFAGRTDPAIIRDLMARNEIQSDEAEKLLPAVLEVYTSTLMNLLTPSSVRVYPGVMNLVRKLHSSEDLVLGLLTGNLRETAYLKLHAAGLGSFFPFGAFGSDRELRNDLPEVAAERATATTGHIFAPHKTIVIGDTPLDFECARVHGARCVGVSTGPYSRDELAEHAPDLLMDDFSDPSELYAFIRAC